MTKFFLLALKKSPLAIHRPRPTYPNLVLFGFISYWFFPPCVFSLSSYHASISTLAVYLYYLHLPRFPPHPLSLSLSIPASLILQLVPFFFLTPVFTARSLSLFLSSFLSLAFGVCNVISLYSKAFVIALSFTYKYIYASTQTRNPARNLEEKTKERQRFYIILLGLAEVKLRSLDTVFQRRFVGDHARCHQKTPLSAGISWEGYTPGSCLSRHTRICICTCNPCGIRSLGGFLSPLT